MKPTRAKQLRSVKPRNWIMQPWQVRAALDNRLGQLRVPVKPQPPSREWFLKRSGQDCGFYEFVENDYLLCGSVGIARDEMGQWPKDDYWHCPFGAPGSVVVGKEAHYVESAGYPDGREQFIIYKATEPDAPVSLWTPASRMPAWASRFRFRVTAVRVERLKEATEADALACGVDMTSRPAVINGEPGTYHPITPTYELARCWNESWARKGFPWEASPWCWVVSLEREVQG